MTEVSKFVNKTESNGASHKKGILTGIGVGPGDPELMTLKAYRTIKSASIISYLANEQGKSQAKWIAREALEECHNDLLEIPVLMPMNENRKIANQVYDSAASEIMACLDKGQNVVFLCEGDPLFFGSFSYLLERIEDKFQCNVIPGISSVHAASATLIQPLTQQTESFAVVSGRHSDEVLIETLKTHDSVVIMKAGRARVRILKALQIAQRTQDASYLEYIGREQQVIVNNVSELVAEAGPYFSLFIVRRSERKHND